MDIEKAKEFFNSIPMEELFAEIRRVTDLSELSFNTKVIDTGSRLSIPSTSQDIVDRVGFLKLIFKELHVQVDGMVSVNREGEFIYWCIVDMDYNHPGGGHNGFPFLHANYTEKTGWHFEEYHGI